MLYIAFILTILLSSTGCQQKPQVRHYTQVTIEDRTLIAWQTPSGWQEQGASQMRLATWHLAVNPAEFDCSLVALPGDAGGVKANLKRWMGQIGLEIPENRLDQFITDSPNHIFDFTRLQKGQPAGTPSMIAAISDIQGTTVFVKLKGSIKVVERNREDFINLVQSIHLK
jgi:hypothetical protein